MENEKDLKVGDVVGNTVHGFIFKILSFRNNSSYVDVENIKTGEFCGIHIDSLRKPNKESKMKTKIKELEKALNLLESARGILEDSHDEFNEDEFNQLEDIKNIQIYILQKISSLGGIVPQILPKEEI